jgi:hypothetical protein
MDEYTHCNDDQLKYGYWYFHKFPNGSYKGGTFKGLDITLGNNKDKYCGILIRSIYDIENKKNDLWAIQFSHGINWSARLLQC